MQNIDVEKIMEEIRQEIIDRGLSEEDLHFPDARVKQTYVRPGEGYNDEEMSEQCFYMNTHFSNPIYWPLQGNPVKVFIQKIIRRVFRFVIYEAFQFQNRFNVGVVRAMNQVKHHIDESRHMAAVIASQQQELDECKKQIAELREQLEAMRK